MSYFIIKINHTFFNQINVFLLNRSTVLTARSENSSGKSSFVIGAIDQLIRRCLYLAYSLSTILADVGIKKPLLESFLHSSIDFANSSKWNLCSIFLINSWISWKLCMFWEIFKDFVWNESNFTKWEQFYELRQLFP